MNDAASAPEATGDGAAPRISLGKGRALVPVPQPAPRADFVGGLGRSHGVVAAGVAVVMGLGFVAGTAAFASKPQTLVLAQALPQAVAPADPTMEALNRVQGEVRALHASLDGLRSAADDARQAETIRGLKKTVDTLKQDVEGVRAASAASAGAVGQLGSKIDRLDRDPGPRLAEIAARLDRLDKPDRDPTPKLAEISARLDRLDREPDGKATDRAADRAADKASEAKLAQATAQLAARLDRVERQVASSDVTGSIPPQASAAAQARAPLPPPRAAQATSGPSAPASIAQPPAGPSPVAAVPPPRPDTAKAEIAKAEIVKAEPNRADPNRPLPSKPEVVARAEVVAPHQPDAPARPATVDGWLLRDVYGGVALVEGRAGGLREVAPGEYVPGVGEIRSIERRGRGWVVVTSRGLIQADNRW